MPPTAETGETTAPADPRDSPDANRRTRRLLLLGCLGLLAATGLALIAFAMATDASAGQLFGATLLLLLLQFGAVVVAWPALHRTWQRLLTLDLLLSAAAPMAGGRWPERWLQAAQTLSRPPPPPAAPAGVLEQALDHAEQASRSKSQFLTTLSHEIRTPMNGVIGLLQLLAGTPLDSQQRNYLSLMQRSAGGLMGLLDELMDFSRIEAGELQLQPRAVPLRLLLDEAAAEVQPLALDRGLLLEVLLSPELPPQVQADPARLRQLVLHLLRNAIKFTEVGQVLLAARPVADGLEISVSDTGPGIAPELQPLVFTPFVQGDDSVARRQGGIGLGLAVVHHLVQAMGGRVELDSQPGRGACFTATLRLPVLAQPAPVPAAEPRLGVAIVSDAAATRQALHDRLRHLGHDEVGAFSWRELAAQPEALALGAPRAVVFDEPTGGWTPQLHGLLSPPAAADGRPAWRPVLLLRRAGSKLPPVANPLVLARPLADADLARTLEAVARDAVEPNAPATATAPTAVGARVLLVEDDEVSQLVAHRLLEQMGCRVEVAADAEAALRHLSEADFAAVLMDCQLPGLDGYEATRRIRQGDAGLRAQRTPIIALTAHASTADRDQCLAAGMNDYLSKPVDAQQLRTTVERWLPQPRREP